MKASLAALVLAAAAGWQASTTVPSALMSSGARSPTEFAISLAVASVPSGLEVRESDDGPPSPRAALVPGFGEKVPVSQALSVFNAQRQDYRARITDGAIVIRPLHGTAAYLDKSSDIPAATKVVGVMAAARRIFVALAPELGGPIAVSGSRKGEDLPLVLDGSGGRTVIDTLNQIVAQAPGRAWVVTTRQDPDGGVRVTAFGFIEGDGSRRNQPMPARSR